MPAFNEIIFGSREACNEPDQSTSLQATHGEMRRMPCSVQFKVVLWTVIGRRAMREFIAQQNIKRFRDLLATEQDEGRRAWLVRVLAEEEAKLGGKPDPEANSCGSA